MTEDAQAGGAVDETDAEIAAVMLRYARFAREEAPGRSERYAQWAAGVAADETVAAVLARIPASHRQPPLVFAVSRMLGAPLSGFRDWAAFVTGNADALVAECRVRSVQTNEPLRCAALLPALSLIDGPVALLEVGAAAGLCLFPDRYSYRYLDPAGRSVAELDPAAGPSAVSLAAELRGSPALRLPRVVWRRGIDLRPLDAGNQDDRAWLTGAVWPGEEGREERIRAALDVASADPPRIVEGDATEPCVLAAAVADAPAGATLVVTTPGVLPHVPRAGRERLADAVAELGARWISLDPPQWRPWAGDDGFHLTVDGVVVAAADPLGGRIAWRG